MYTDITEEYHSLCVYGRWHSLNVSRQPSQTDTNAVKGNSYMQNWPLDQVSTVAVIRRPQPFAGSLTRAMPGCGLSEGVLEGRPKDMPLSQPLVWLFAEVTITRE